LKFKVLGYYLISPLPGCFTATQHQNFSVSYRLQWIILFLVTTHQLYKFLNKTFISHEVFALLA